MRRRTNGSGAAAERRSARRQIESNRAKVGMKDERSWNGEGGGAGREGVRVVASDAAWTDVIHLTGSY